MATIEELIASVREAPDDDGLRMVLADALIERGDPWGELIALSLHQLDTPDLVARYDELYVARWGKLEGFADRGFFDDLTVLDATVPLVTQGPEFAWVKDLRAEVTDAGLAALVGTPLIAGAETLALVSARDDAPIESIENVLACVAASRCRELTLRQIAIGHADLVTLLALPPVRALRRLEISGHPQLAGQLDDLAWPALEALELNLGVRSADLAAVLRCPALHDLRTLSVGYNQIDDLGMRTLVRTPFTRLSRLEIASIDISDDGLAMLTESPIMRRLTSLAVGVTSGPLATALPGLAALTELTELEIDTETEAGAIAAFYDALTAPLERLEVHLRDVPLGAAVPRLDLPKFSGLRHLDFSFQELPDAAVQRIADAELPKLAQLNLNHCKLTPEGTLALIASRLPHDLSLSFRGNSVGPHAAALTARFAHVYL